MGWFVNFGGCGGWGDGGFTPAGHKLRLHRPHSKKAEAHRGMVNSLLANATCHRHVAPKARCAKACGPWSSFRIHHPNKRNSEPSLKAQLAIWWGMVDLPLRGINFDSTAPTAKRRPRLTAEPLFGGGWWILFSRTRHATGMSLPRPAALRLAALGARFESIIQTKEIASRA